MKTCNTFSVRIVKSEMKSASEITETQISFITLSGMEVAFNSNSGHL